MSGGGGQNTTTQVQQIPEYQQQFSQENQDLARSLGSQPYPQYQGQLIQPLNAVQQQGQQQAFNSATDYAPIFDQAHAQTLGALNGGAFTGEVQGANTSLRNSNDNLGNSFHQLAGTVQGAQNQQGLAAQRAQDLTNPYAVSGYISPYVSQALQPQIQQLNLQLAQQQRGIDSQATQANAFGDARQGAAQSLQNFYGNSALNNLIGTGYNNAYSQALSALGQAQGTQLGVANQFGNIAQTGLGAAQQYGNIANSQISQANQYGQLAGLANQQQQVQLAGANQLGNLSGQLQNQELSGANAVYNAGSQQQTQQQQQLNAAYQQYLNQVNWPYQQLNVRESALSNSPYNIATSVTLPNANSTAQGFGSLLALGGLAGALGGNGGQQSASTGSPFGRTG